MGYSDYLFAQPGFMEGLARMMDVTGVLNQYNQMSTPEQADALATWSDWMAVGAEISSAASQMNSQVRFVEQSSVEKK